MVPDFPNFVPLDKEHREVLANYFRQNPPFSSEYTFSNFFIWRGTDRSRIAVLNHNLCVLAYPDNATPYFFEPLGNRDIPVTLELLFAYLKEEGFPPYLGRVTDEFINRYLKETTAFRIEPDRANFDYLYRVEDLVELSGRRFDGKRNRIKKFLSQYAYEYLSLTPALVPECQAVHEAWLTEKRRESESFPTLEHEAEATREALNYQDFLGLRGAVVRVNGRVEAFTLGEGLNNDTAVVYIEKANPALPGLAQLINREFARNAWSNFTYIDREQDLGHPGLRRAKLSYHPCRLIPKYNVYPEREVRGVY